MDSIRTFVRHRLFEGQPRSIRAKRNMVGLFILRGASTAINFILVPLTLHYLNPTKYGIWMTLSSIVGWVIWMDIGLGNGLRNKFAIALAQNDKELARSYVSTTYAFVGLVSILIFLLFWVVQPFISWSGILNAGPTLEHEVSILAAASFSFFCLRLVVGLIGTILIADQRPASSSILEVIASAVLLIAIVLLFKIAPGSLFWLGTCSSGAMALVPLAANIVHFRGRYKDFAPAFRYVNIAHARELMQMGIQFFALQLVGTFLFASSNVVITQLFGPSEVTEYNIANKYFGVPAMVFAIILTPLWSAYTDAYVRGDIPWITMTFKKLRRLFLVLVLVVAVMVACADWVYTIWVGATVRVPFALSLFTAFYVLVIAWNNIFSYFLAGTGKIRLQLLVSAMICIFVIPLVLLLARVSELRSAAVVLATCLVLIPGSVLWPIQTAKIISGRATGLWAR